MGKVISIQVVEKSNTILSIVFDNQEGLSTCNYAIISITEDLINLITFLRKSVESVISAGIDANEIGTFANNAIFLNDGSEVCFNNELVLSTAVLDQIIKTNVNDEGFVFVEDDIMENYKDELHRLEIDDSHLFVDLFSFWFSAYIKHTDIRLSTEKIPFHKINI